MNTAMRAREPKAKTIGLFGFDGLAALDLTGPLEALTSARLGDANGGTPCYSARIISLTGKTFVSQSGAAFRAECLVEKAPPLDTVIVPGGVAARAGGTFRRIADWLATNAVHVRRIVAICTGIYPLAESGLLDGRQAATHWRFAQDVARRFPKVRLNPTASFTRDGPFYTCGGGTAAIELTLALIEEDYGARVALSVARELGVRLRPIANNESSFDPAQFECGPADRLAELPAWINAHLGDNLSVEVLAERACICPRHFTRLFKRQFQRTPAEFVETLRLNEAQRRLLRPRESIQDVATSVGFKSSDSFRRAFQRHIGVNPAMFRKMNAQAKWQNGNGRSAYKAEEPCTLPARG